MTLDVRHDTDTARGSGQNDEAIGHLALTDAQLDRMVGGGDGPPTSIGTGNGLTGGNPSPLLM